MATLLLDAEIVSVSPASCRPAHMKHTHFVVDDRKQGSISAPPPSKNELTYLSGDEAILRGDGAALGVIAQ